jgi:hypothetical protein
MVQTAPTSSPEGATRPPHILRRGTHVGDISPRITAASTLECSIFSFVTLEINGRETGPIEPDQVQKTGFPNRYIGMRDCQSRRCARPTTLSVLPRSTARRRSMLRRYPDRV